MAAINACTGSAKIWAARNRSSYGIDGASQVLMLVIAQQHRRLEVLRIENKLADVVQPNLNGYSPAMLLGMTTMKANGNER
jgi:hypothetical protein